MQAVLWELRIVRFRPTFLMPRELDETGRSTETEHTHFQGFKTQRIAIFFAASCSCVKFNMIVRVKLTNLLIAHIVLKLAHFPSNIIWCVHCRINMTYDMTSHEKYVN